MGKKLKQPSKGCIFQRWADEGGARLAETQKAARIVRADAEPDAVKRIESASSSGVEVFSLVPEECLRGSSTLSSDPLAHCPNWTELVSRTEMGRMAHYRPPGC